MRSIYLDYAAATPMDQRAIVAAQPYWSDKFYNPSAIYDGAAQVARELAAFRSQVALTLGVRNSEITFTAGATEANNLAIHGVMQTFTDKQLVVSAVEHPSVLVPAQQYDHRLWPVTTDGLLDLTQADRILHDDVVLVSVILASNEIGVIQPLGKLSQLIAVVRRSRQSRGIRTPLYLHSDACQGANYLPLKVDGLGVDMLTLNGGKIYASKQSGALFVNRSVKLAPQLQGGDQQRLRPGTEQVSAIASFATMLQKVQTDQMKQTTRIAKLRDMLFTILSQKIENVQLNGSRSRRLANNLNLSFPGIDNERLVMELDQVGVQLATGSACLASSDKQNHVLAALGLSDALANSSIRISLGAPTKEDDVRTAAQRIVEVVERLGGCNIL